MEKTWFLVDYENTNSEGLRGIEDVPEGNNVTIFYSDKNDKMDMGMVQTLRECNCSVDMVKTGKTAPNYMDIQIICHASCLVCEKDAESVWIISKDKGYISARDFFDKRSGSANAGRILLEDSIEKALKNIEKISAEKEAAKEVRKTETAAIEPAARADSKKEKVKAAKGTKDKVSQTKKLTADEKAVLKEMLKNIPKHNGKLQQTVIDCFNECSTLGQIRYKLNSEVGRQDGEKTYKIIESMFAEFKGIKIGN